MTLNKCRACGGDFFKGDLLKLKNMPKAAQHMPDEKGLSSDRGIYLVIRQCALCGLIQLDNDPVPYYKDVIRATSVSASMKAFREKQFKAFVKKYGLNNKKMIEIGCGNGDYLSIMAQAGVKAYGLENNAESVKYCRKNRLNAQKGFVNGLSYKIKGAPFDGFYMMSFLEHLPDLRGVVAGIRNNLKDGACGLVEVPNFGMMLKKKLYAEFIIDHLFYFTKDTLKAFLSNNGFDVLECRPIWHDYILSAVVKKKNVIPLNNASLYFEKMKKEINAYINGIKEKGKRIAIWGAGHQAFTIMSICELSGKIEYVVDSAPFKQDKYTPATHIPIVAPSALDKNPVDAIMILAGSYSDEIYKTIKNKYGTSMEVRILRGNRIEKSA
jgi:SAM-dependent methyltransferase